MIFVFMCFVCSMYTLRSKSVTLKLCIPLMYRIFIMNDQKIKTTNKITRKKRLFLSFIHILVVPEFPVKSVFFYTVLNDFFRWTKCSQCQISWYFLHHRHYHQHIFSRIGCDCGFVRVTNIFQMETCLSCWWFRNGKTVRQNRQQWKINLIRNEEKWDHTIERRKELV